MTTGMKNDVGDAALYKGEREFMSFLIIYHQIQKQTFEHNLKYTMPFTPTPSPPTGQGKHSTRIRKAEGLDPYGQSKTTILQKQTNL